VVQRGHTPWWQCSSDVNRYNNKGEATTGYDPINDVQWLREEVHAYVNPNPNPNPSQHTQQHDMMACSWIFHNLWKRWGNIVRKHTAASMLLVDKHLVIDTSMVATSD
jgi:hypothetical protein